MISKMIGLIRKIPIDFQGLSLLLFLRQISTVSMFVFGMCLSRRNPTTHLGSPRFPQKKFFTGLVKKHILPMKIHVLFVLVSLSNNSYSFRMLNHSTTIITTIILTITICEQYTHKYSTYRVAQHDHISSREHAWLKSWKAQDCTSLCPETIVIHVSCLIPCRT